MEIVESTGMAADIVVMSLDRLASARSGAASRMDHGPARGKGGRRPDKGRC